MTNNDIGKEKNSKSLLGGIRILELGHALAGPFSATLLADFGAEVIKVEEPGIYDSLRASAPKKKQVSLWWKVTGRNKKTITLNLKEPKGQEICKQLISKCDAIVENFRPGTLEKWNLGWDKLRVVNPSLIMLRVTGYGQTGPYSARPGFGKAAEAMSGVMQITGHPDRQPISPGFSFADTISGLTGAFALMMALYHRDGLDTKMGQVIDVALFESVFRLIEWQAILFDQLGVIPKRKGANFALESSFLINNYLTKDNKWIAVSAASRAVLNRVLKLIGGEKLCSDDRFNTNDKVTSNMNELDTIVSNWMKEHEQKEIVRLFSEAGAVAAPIYDIKEIFEDVHYSERNDIITLDDPDLGRLRMVGVMPKFPSMPGKVRWAGASTGSFNQEVYCGLLGMTPAELESLKGKGII